MLLFFTCDLVCLVFSRCVDLFVCAFDYVMYSPCVDLVCVVLLDV